MNAVIFARGNNVREQVEKCREYAERNGYTVACVIVGGNYEITGTIKSLQEDMKIDCVLVNDIVRLSRNALENYAIQAELELDCGVVVEDVSAKERNEVQEKLMQNIIKAVYGNDVRERIKLQARMKGL